MPGTDRPQVVVAFPGAGGSAGMFGELRKRLSGTADLVVPDTPGRGKRRRSTLTVRALAAELCTELHQKIGDREYTVFAACFGTLIAYELLREQRRRGLRMPVRFLVCGRAAPDESGSFDAFAGWSDERLDEFMKQTLPADHGWTRMPEELREVVRYRLRKDIELGLSYEYREENPLELPIHAYGGLDDAYTSREDLVSWGRHTAGDYVLRIVTGGTYFYLESPDTICAALTGRTVP